VGTAWTNLIQTFLVIPTGATTGARITINVDQDGAILVYNAAGQLFESIAAEAGEDQFGNPFPAGFTVGVPGSPQVEITIATDGKSGVIFFPTDNPDISNPSFIQGFQEGTGTSSHDQLQIVSALDSTQLDRCLTAWLSSSTDGTSQSPQIQEYYLDPLGNFHQYYTLGLAGASIAAGSVTAVQPGTGTSRANVAVPETWHTAALGAGFTTNVADQVPRYRFEPIAGGQVRLDGVVYTSAATAAGATMLTLPLGYRPTARKRFNDVTSVSGNTLGATLVEVLATGVVELAPAASAAGQQIVLDGITFPVD
jgi:hypothetical protein